MNDTIEMRLNGKVLECVDRNPEWIDGQIYGDRPVPQSGSQWWTRAGEQKLKLLRLQYAAEPGLFRRGLNKISLCVRKRGPNGGARAPIQVEKVEVYVGRRTE